MPLHGVGVLVTRPELQAMPLCRLFEAQGAATLRLPAIEIKPLKLAVELKRELGSLENFDVVIFTSVNAVRFGAVLLEQRRDLTVAAIGPATARALNQAGYRVAIQPRDSVDSEGLLKSPQLQHIAGHRILIIKGSGGRDLLKQQLVRRGAAVRSADVYERRPAAATAALLAAVHAQFAAGELQVIAAASVEVVRNLLRMATPDLRGEFARALWLVPGERVAAGVRELGVMAPLLQAQSAEDQDLVTALIRWRSSVSGA